MASTATGLLEWVRDRLAAVVDGTGNYNHDLTATDAVAITGFPAPNQVGLGTRVMIHDYNVDTVPGRPLTGWDNTMSIFLTGFVQGDGTMLSQHTEALDLQADIHRALRSDRIASGATILSTSSVQDVRVETASIDGNALGYRGRVMAAARVTIPYRGDL